VSRKSEQHAAPLDVAGLAHRYLDGELSPAEQSSLAELLRDQVEPRTEFVRCLVHQVRLEEVLARRRSEAALNAIESPSATGSALGAESDTDRPLDDGKPAGPVLGFISKLLAPGGGNINAPMLFMLLLVCTLLGAGLATWFANRANPSVVSPRDRSVATADPQQLNAPRAAAYSASLVSVTNCRWDSTHGPLDIVDGRLQPGQPIHLLEGVARINSTLTGGGNGEFQLEGPLAMILTSEGMPSLLYGKLTGDFSGDFDRFTLDTPLGRVAVAGDASIGVTAAANDVELHVFSGEASLETWAIGLGGAAEPLKAPAGTSLRVRVASDGAIAIDRGKSRENRFVTPAALAASQLSISRDYVSAVRAAEPLAYWRFEAEMDGLVRNEVADRLHCRMVGDAVRLHPGQDNTTAEFGITAGPGYLASDDTTDGLIGENYAVEAWVKPTYYHHGALFSLLEWSATKSPHQTHQLHLELCGPISGFPDQKRITDFYPGRIRFIHHTAECFSASPYTVRKWQHIAAVKEGSAMRLYADGKLVAGATDSRKFGTGLRILMGQLYPQSPLLRDDVTSRLFVGELDEVALYDHAIDEVEIQKHIELARPSSEATH
jgi:hypothetical protein